MKKVYLVEVGETRVVFSSLKKAIKELEYQLNGITGTPVELIKSRIKDIGVWSDYDGNIVFSIEAFDVL